MYTTDKNWHLNCWLLIFSVFLLNKNSNLKTMNTIKNDWSFKNKHCRRGQTKVKPLKNMEHVLILYNDQ